MQFSFDLISDINKVNPNAWDCQPTSLYCVVAGNVHHDRLQLKHTLEKVATQYSTVMYIDGHLDHVNHIHDLDTSCLDLKRELSDLTNVVYLHDNCVIVDKLAFLGANCWWTFDWNPEVEQEQMMQWLEAEWQCRGANLHQIIDRAHEDANYLGASLQKLQQVDQIQEIVMISNTVPLKQIVSNDPAFKNKYDMGIQGSSLIERVLKLDIHKKVRTWCFGHYPYSFDERINGIRYCCNSLINRPPYPLKIVTNVTSSRQVRS